MVADAKDLNEILIKQAECYKQLDRASLNLPTYLKNYANIRSKLIFLNFNN